MGYLKPDQIKARFSKLKGDRSNFETHWQEIADYILPRKDNITRVQYPGNKKGITLLDNTGVQSNELLSGALHGMLTSPNLPWFELTTGKTELDQEDDVRLFLQECTLRLHNVLNNSNFQTEVHELYMDLCAFGTAIMSAEEDDETVIRFSTKFIADVCIDENNQGTVDCLYRKFKWSAQEILNEWGNNAIKVSRILQSCIEKADDKDHEIIHAIYPQKRIDGKQKGPFAFVSQYILCEDSTELFKKGFNEFPFLVPRWSKASGEIYGRSPGMVALPEMKTINKMTETVIIGAQKVVDPPLQAPDDGFVLPVKTHPGGMNYYRAGGNDRIEPIFNDTRIDFGFEAVRERRTKVREAFFIDQLQLGNGPQMTATEVMQRTEERMRLLGPMLGRMQSEFLKPLVDRLFQIMYRKGLLPQAPDILQGSVIDVQYSSMVARTQRMTEGQNIMRTVQALTPFIQMDQSVMDYLNGDMALKKIAKIYGFPQDVIRKDKEVKQIRESRAQAQQQMVQAQQQQMQVEQMQGAAKTAKDASAAEEMGEE